MPNSPNTAGGRAIANPDKLIGIALAPSAHPERPCIVAGDRSYTRRQVRNEIARSIADLRSNGVAQGDRVLALLDHDPAAVFFLAAASALGLHLMMPYGLQSAALPEWLSIVTGAEPDVVVHHKRDRTGLDELRAVSPRLVELPHRTADSEDAEVDIDHPAAIDNFQVLFTSGTTGAPKAISIAERHICARIASITETMRYGPDSRIFMTGLMNNTTGVINTFGALLHDAVVVFPESNQPARWPAEVATQRATHLALRPVALKQFVSAATAGRIDLSCLEVMSYGGAAVPSALIEQGRELITCQWIQGYGLSETYGPFCFLDESGHRDRRYRQHVYCIGRPDSTLDVRIEPVASQRDGVGEILLRGTAVMEGYVDVATRAVRAPGEWFRTGDLAAWSPDGDLVLKGRTQGALLSENGHRIYPEEIEAVLAELPGADDVILVGLSYGTIHERPVACLCGPIGAQDPSALRRIVIEQLEHSLAPEKWPDFLYATTFPFPRSANGKVMRGAVAQGIDRAAVLELSGARRG